MEKKTKGKKKLAVLLASCVAFLVAAGVMVGIVISNRATDVSTIHTVVVKDQNGNPVEEVCLSLYGPDDKEATWLPYVTNITGEVKYTQDIGEGYYVKVAGVPMGYKLDDSIQYKFEGDKMVIVLGEDDSVYIAQIGDQKFFSFSSAVGVANGSNEDVTIELLADVTINTATLKNSYSKTITIDGGGHTVTTAGGNNVFLVNQNEGVVEFKNMNIKHTNTGSVLQIGGLATVNMTDVKIDATDGTAYNYALINTMAVDGTTTLNFTRVDVKMAVGSPAKAEEAGIIRTGNTSGTKNVDMNLMDCNFDTTGASGRQCIVVMKNTVATINATNSTFKSGDSYAIWAREQSKEQTLTMTNCTATAEGEKVAKSPIEGYFAMIGDTYYLPLSAALKKANESGSNITVKLFKDITIKTCDINNKKGKLVTIDGCGKTVTTSGGNNAFVVGNNVMFKNMTINHKNTGSAIHITTAGNVSASNVTIKATEGKTYSYSLINALATGTKKTTIDLNRVNVVWAVESKGDANASVIRTGNPSVRDSDGKVITDNSKIVDIILRNCNFDTTKATGRTGITVTRDAKTYVKLERTAIKTMDTYAIRSYEQEIEWNNADTTLTSLDGKYQVYPVEGYLAKIGDVFYTFKKAVATANAATSDTEIKLLANYSIGGTKINNKAGKTITLDGYKNPDENYTITSSGGTNKHAFTVGNNVTFKNMTIVHKNFGSVVEITSPGKITLSKVKIDATNPSNKYEKKNDAGEVIKTVKNTYTYALINVVAKGESTLDLSDVDVSMAVAGRSEANGYTAIIRTGNASERDEAGNIKPGKDNDKIVHMKLKNCNLDTTRATDRNGIVIMKGTQADIELTGTSINTLEVPAIRNYDETYLGTVKVDEKSNLQMTVSERFTKGKDEIKGYKYQIGDTWYTMDRTLDLKADTTKDLTGEISLVINTNGYCLTTTGDKDESVTINSEAKYTVGKETYWLSLQDALSKAESVEDDVEITVMNDCNVDFTTVTDSNNYTTKINTVANGGCVNVTAGEPGNGIEIIAEATYKIGEINGYASFEKAAAKVREANVPSTITLSSDISVGKNINISNKNGKAVTINGGNKTITTSVKNALTVENKDSVVTLQNVNLKHKAVQGTVAVLTTATLNLKNVNISVEKTDYQYGLINLFGKDNGNNTIVVNMENVNVDMSGVAVKSANDPSHAIIRTGNNGVAGTKIVKLNMTNCNLNASTSTEVHGIMIMDTTTATVTMNGTSISTKDVAPIYNGSTTSTVERTGGTFACTDGAVKIGAKLNSDVFYDTLKEALEAAKTKTADTTIEICSDIAEEDIWADTSGTEKYVNFVNSKGKNLTLDGNWCTMTIGQKTKNALRVQSPTTMKEIDVSYGGVQALINVTKATTLTLDDVEINASTNSNTYLQFGIIIVSVENGTINLNLTDTDIKVFSPEYTKGDTCVIRGGNTGHSKTVKINMTNSTFDATGSKGRMGIWIPDKTVADVTMTDSKITVDKTTYDKCAAMYGAGSDNSIVKTLTLNGTSEMKVLTSGEPLVQEDALYRTTLTNNTVAAVAMESEPETKQIILEVPVNLYDKFVEWIKDFGTIWNWDTGL